MRISDWSSDVCSSDLIDVTLDLILTVSNSKEWSMTFIAVQCPHCLSEQIVKRGKTRRGKQRYLCQNIACTQGSFLLDYRNRGCLQIGRASCRERGCQNV